MLRSLAVLALAGSIAFASDAPPSGLLLGCSSAEDSRYETLWIYDDGQEIRILRAPDLLLPRKDGFWRIGTYRTLETSDEDAQFRPGQKATSEESDIWAVPSRQIPSITLASNQKVITHWTDSPCDHTDRDISFINPTHIWYGEDSEYVCATHPDSSLQLYAARIEDRRTRIGISEMLGPTGFQAYSQAVATAFEETKKEAGYDCEPTIDPADWRIERDQGAWKVTGWATTHRVCGYGLDLKIQIALPPSITGYDRLPKAWAGLAAEIPGLLDAFSSPTKRLLVAVTKKEMLIYRPSGPRIGPPLFRYPFDRDADLYTVVMAQWAVGASSVARWTKEVESTREIRPVVRRR